MNNNGKKIVLVLIAIVALIYVFSPVDLLPGPIDDTIVIVCSLSSLLRLKSGGVA